MLKPDPAMQKEYQEAIQKYEKWVLQRNVHAMKLSQRTVVPFIMYLLMS